MRYSVTKKGDEDKAATSLQRLAQEDLTIRIENDSANHQTLVYGISEQHLEVVTAKLLDKYKVEIKLEEPRIAYKETILGKTDVEYKYKKQSSSGTFG